MISDNGMYVCYAV